MMTSSNGISTNKALRVLQVEDSDNDAATVVCLLEKAGYDVHSERVDDGPGFQRALKGAGWDIIIADNRMPRFDASEALNILRQSGQDIPLIIVSGSIGEERAVEMMRMGASDYLMKSNLARLAPAVEREAREAEARRCRRQSDELLLLATSATQVGTFDYNPQTTELVWSAITRKHFGVSENTPVTADMFFRGVHPDDRAREAAERTRVLQGNQGDSFAGEYRIVGLEDGIHRWISLAGRIFFDAQGKPLRAVGVTLDITERRNLEEQLRQAHKLETIGTLAGGIAHDFNNILGVIIGCADMATQTPPADQEVREALEEISRAGQRGAALIRKLLTFSRRQSREPRTIQVNGLIADVEKMIRRLIHENVELVFSLDPQAGAVVADLADIEQAIVNLVVNARDAMPHGGRICVETGRQSGEMGDFVVIRVTDNGTGMTDEVKNHIFEPFFTTKEQGKGTGLGLSTVYGVVAQSNGTIGVTSTPGMGSTFEMKFPRAEGASEQAANEKPAPLPMRKRTVLLVEDEESLRALIRMALRRHGYTVVEAANGRAALEISRAYEKTIDLVLADVVMPEMSGPELADVLASERPGVPVVFMSGYADHHILHERIAGGYLQKPFTAATLLARLESVWQAEPSAARMAT